MRGGWVGSDVWDKVPKKTIFLGPSLTLTFHFLRISHMFRSMKAEPSISSQMYQHFHFLKCIQGTHGVTDTVSGVGGETDHDSYRLRTKLSSQLT